MTELNCAICDKEVGFLGQVNLSDGNFICKDCERKISPFFNPSESSIVHYHECIKQQENGRKLYNAYFAKNKKTVHLCDNQVLYDPGTALICIYGERGGIFNKEKFYTVFPITAVRKYETANRFLRKADGENCQIPCVFLLFENNRKGVSSFMIPTEAGKARKLMKFLNQILACNDGLSQKADDAIREVL